MSIKSQSKSIPIPGLLGSKALPFSIEMDSFNPKLKAVIILGSGEDKQDDIEYMEEIRNFLKHLLNLLHYRT